MRKLLRKLWRDDRGYVLAMEWIYVSSILTLGTVAALVAFQHVEEEDTPSWPAALTR
jgi:hypothetical protein